jgi:hypothetical protein
MFQVVTTPLCQILVLRFQILAVVAQFRFQQQFILEFAQ